MDLDPGGILEAVSQVSSASTSGQEELTFLNQLLSVRVAGIVTNSLQDTARATGASARQVTSALDRSTLTVKVVLENSSTWLINALKAGDETASRNALDIKDQIADLTSRLAKAAPTCRLRAARAAI